MSTTPKALRRMLPVLPLQQPESKSVSITRRVHRSRLTVDDRHALIVERDGRAVLFDVSNSRPIWIDASDAATLKSLPTGATRAQFDVVLPRLSAALRDEFEAGRLLSSDVDRKAKAAMPERLHLVDVVVQVSYACNMACSYCYADKGLYGGGEAKLLSEEVARDIVDFAIANRGGSELGFVLLGGEPLMNMKVIKVLVDYARGRGAEEGVKTDFLITTNGLLLTDANLAFFKENNIDIRLSIDGKKDLHDEFRPTSDGKPTFDIINRRGQKLRDSGVPHSVRASIFGNRGAEILEQVKTLLVENQYGHVKVDFLWGEPGTPGLIDESNLDDALNGIDHVSEWFMGEVLAGRLSWTALHPLSKYFGRLGKRVAVSNVFNFDDQREETFENGSLLERNGVECGAGVNVISISPDGGIYSCHRTEGMKEHKMGSIYSGVNMQALNYWLHNWRLEQADCQTCWARYVCIGGCPAFGAIKHADPMRNDRVKCEIRRQYIANAIWLYAELELQRKATS